MELRALKGRIVQRLSIAAEAAPVEQPEPVVPEIPPFTAPRTYALVDTLEGLDHWIEAAQQAGTVAVWPEGSAVAGTRPGLAGIALGLAPGLAAYVPLAHRATGTLDLGGTGDLSMPAGIDRLRPLLEDPGVL